MLFAQLSSVTSVTDRKTYNSQQLMLFGDLHVNIAYAEFSLVYFCWQRFNRYTSTCNFFAYFLFPFYSFAFFFYAFLFIYCTLLHNLFSHSFMLLQMHENGKWFSRDVSLHFRGAMKNTLLIWNFFSRKDKLFIRFSLSSVSKSVCVCLGYSK